MRGCLYPHPIKAESEETMNEVGVEIIKAEEANESEIKYLNINVSNSEVERNPDIVRLCSDAGILEYVKPKTGALDKIRTEIEALEDGISSYHNDRPWIYKDEVLAIIDKYKAESEEA